MAREGEASGREGEEEEVAAAAGCQSAVGSPEQEREGGIGFEQRQVAEGNRNAVEGDETFAVAVTSVSGGAQVGTAQATG